MRSADLITQAIAATLICLFATLAATLPPEPPLDGAGLATLYAASLTYLFGVQTGKISQRNGELHDELEREKERNNE